MTLEQRANQSIQASLPYPHITIFAILCMLHFIYYKIAGRWYLDLPDYLEQGGAPEDLERDGSLKDLLERVAQGKSSVHLVLDTHPFEGAEEAMLIGESGDHSGAYYLI